MHHFGTIFFFSSFDYVSDFERLNCVRVNEVYSTLNCYEKLEWWMFRVHISHLSNILDQPLVIPNSEISVILIEFVWLNWRYEGHLMARNITSSWHCRFCVTSLHFYLLIFSTLLPAVRSRIHFIHQYVMPEDIFFGFEINQENNEWTLGFIFDGVLVYAWFRNNFKRNDTKNVKRNES